MPMDGHRASVPQIYRQTIAPVDSDGPEAVAVGDLVDGATGERHPNPATGQVVRASNQGLKPILAERIEVVDALAFDPAIRDADIADRPHRAAID